MDHCNVCQEIRTCLVIKAGADVAGLIGAFMLNYPVKIEFTLPFVNYCRVVWLDGERTWEHMTQLDRYYPALLYSTFYPRMYTPTRPVPTLCCNKIKT